jgi:hypothetical protein
MGNVTIEELTATESTLSERRWHERHRSDPSVPVRLIGDSRVSFTAWTRDASSMGIGLTSGRSFDVGTDFAVQLQDGLFTASLKARVVHVQPLPDGKFLLGCSLSRTLTDRELAILLGSGRKNSNGENGEG